MHALVPILIMANEESNGNVSPGGPMEASSAPNAGSSGGNPTFSKEKKRLQALEARAVAEATATADAAFTPSPSLLNASSATALLKQVDGPSLRDYQNKESVYVGRSVPISAGGSLTIPIQVTTPGSVVEYAVESKNYDIGFGITAEREEGLTIVRVRYVYLICNRRISYARIPEIHICCVLSNTPTLTRHSPFSLIWSLVSLSVSRYVACGGVQEVDRVEASINPITGKFLVGTVPCLIQFQFQNDYSWFREKVVSYKVTVTPPSKETLGAGRRRRAKACLKAVEDDLVSAQKRFTSATDQVTTLTDEIEKLQMQLDKAKKSLQVVQTEEKWLKERLELRSQQQELLNERLTYGWEDEKEVTEEEPKKKRTSKKQNGN